MFERIARRGARALGVLGVSGAIAGAASAAPLIYDVDIAASNAFVSMQVNGAVDVTPDFTELLPGGDDFPVFAVLGGTENTAPTGQSELVADVGLPGNFNDGAGGIAISDLLIRYVNFPGILQGFGAISIPLDITGSSFQPIAFTARVNRFDIVLNSPISSPLVASGNPNEWLWSALADATIVGEFAPLVTIPGQDPISLDPVPFSQNVLIPLAGIFTGDANGTEVHVGIPSGALENQDLSLPPISEQINLAELGVVTAFFQLDTLVLTDIATSTVFENATPIPEPSTATLVVLGLGALALRRRR